MSALHAAVARALRQEMWVVKVAGLSDAEAKHLARAAVGVMRKRVEALDFPHGQLLACYISGELAAKVGQRPYECPVHQGDACLFVFAAVTDVLAALAEEPA